MSTTVIAVVVMLLAQVLPIIGIHLENAALESFVQTLVSIVAGVWIYARRVSQPDVNAFGFKQ